MKRSNLLCPRVLIRWWWRSRHNTTPNGCRVVRASQCYHNWSDEFPTFDQLFPLIMLPKDTLAVGFHFLNGDYLLLGCHVFGPVKRTVVSVKRTLSFASSAQKKLFQPNLLYPEDGKWSLLLWIRGQKSSSKTSLIFYRTKHNRIQK